MSSLLSMGGRGCERWSLVAESLPQPWQNVACEQFEGSSLVGAWRVKNKFRESELHVRGYLVDDGVRIIGDDEPRLGAVAVCICQPLELNGIFDPHLLVA